MDVEDELRRVLSEDRLDVPVRTGAEWSLMASARRRRQRQSTYAAVGGVLAALTLAGSGVALVSYQPTEPASPPPPPVVVPSSSDPGVSRTQPPSDGSEEPGGLQPNQVEEPGYEPEYPRTYESDEIPSILRSSESSVPPPTSEVPSSVPSSASEEPSESSSPTSETTSD